jgi:hypothetical protein
MALTPRQVVVRAREAAALLVRALDQERLVLRFVDAYAVQYSRPCCTAYPGQYLETVALLRREALLTMAIWMESEAPRILGLTKRVAIKKASPKAQMRGNAKKSRAKKLLTATGSAAPGPLAVQFLGEFFTTLVEAQQWSAEDVLQFRADLSLYRRLDSQYANVVQPRRFATSRKLAGVVGGPFVDRCGVLLDPSMFDAARRASARFEEHLRLRAGTILKSVFARRRY